MTSQRRLFAEFIAPSPDKVVTEQVSAINHAPPKPFSRLEIATTDIAIRRLHLLLARRANPRPRENWALPGGVLRIEINRLLELAAPASNSDG